MGLGDRLRRLELRAEADDFIIRQADGTEALFRAEQGLEALLDLIDGKDHPLAMAARNSPDPEWSGSFYNSFPIEDLEDLSE